MSKRIYVTLKLATDLLTEKLIAIEYGRSEDSRLQWEMPISNNYSGQHNCDLIRAKRKLFKKIKILTNKKPILLK